MDVLLEANCMLDPCASYLRTQWSPSLVMTLEQAIIRASPQGVTGPPQCVFRDAFVPRRPIRC